MGGWETTAGRQLRSGLREADFGSGIWCELSWGMVNILVQSIPSGYG